MKGNVPKSVEDRLSCVRSRSDSLTAGGTSSMRVLVALCVAEALATVLIVDYVSLPT